MSTLKIKRLLRFYIRLLSFLGIIPIFYSSKIKKYILRTGWRFYVAHCFWQLVYVFLIGNVVMRREKFVTPKYSYLDRCYWIALVSAAMTAQFLINAWFLHLRHSHYHIISYCVYLSEQFISHGQRNVWIWQLIVLVTNIISACSLSLMSSFKPRLIFQIYYIVSTLLLAFYGCITQAIAALLGDVNSLILIILQHNQRRKRITEIELENFHDCLVAYDGLMLLCSENISTIYGAPFVLIAVISTLDITLSVHLLKTITMKGYVQTIIIAIKFIVFALPSVIMLSMAFVGSDIEKEANRTVKILTKFPRTGNGMDTMVDKFLLKNVRKKPILTAYGFFPLDRSALFKLFTAIIMYIVILVQFKDIEQSLKKTR
ncbi:gustatory and pheromone receptor 39a-like isoform X1 [Anastrepha ludens]|uniref:gustatory and pheromone receptor 39a-like isoform X1 n=1 Tax=Anastrepha ludens TaxID=28586 RepID=UPI0023B04552|nr:gustatory and pheromone receptor 39a-like isoform X1 [Anastrepha ludens]